MADTEVTTPQAVLEQDMLHKLHRLSTGRWFHELLVETVRGYNAEAASEPAVSAAPLPAAERIIRNASLKAALLGTGAAAITTGQTAIASTPCVQPRRKAIGA